MNYDTLIMLYNNRSSGSLEPHGADLTFMRKGSDCAEIIGIEMGDYILITEPEYPFFKRKNLLNT